MYCPLCEIALQLVHYEGVEVHECPGCGGEFVGGSQLAHIVQTREQRFGPELLRELEDRTPVYGIPEEEVESDVCCPACSNPMHPVNYASDTAIIIDRCGHCDGVWLDHSELEQIQAISEQWSDEASDQILSISMGLEEARREASLSGKEVFQGSRFSFLNAIINRYLDAA